MDSADRLQVNEKGNSLRIMRRKAEDNERLLFTRCATSNASRHFKSPLAMGRDAFKSKHASSVSISGVIDTGVNSNNERTYYPFTVKKYT